MEPPMLAKRAPVAALREYEKFIEAAEQLKALTLQHRAKRQRESAYLASLTRQIAAVTQVCDEYAAQTPRLRELWKAVQAELKADTESTTTAA